MYVALDDGRTVACVALCRLCRKPANGPAADSPGDLCWMCFACLPLQARPVLSRVVSFVRTTEPALLAEYAVGGIAAYYLVGVPPQPSIRFLWSAAQGCPAHSRIRVVLLSCYGGGGVGASQLCACLQAPPLLRLVFGGLRGYAGDVSPPAALDLVSTRGNTFIIDLRSSRWAPAPRTLHAAHLTNCYTLSKQLRSAPWQQPACCSLTARRWDLLCLLLLWAQSVVRWPQGKGERRRAGHPGRQQAHRAGVCAGGGPQAARPAAQRGQPGAAGAPAGRRPAI